MARAKATDGDTQVNGEPADELRDEATLSTWITPDDVRRIFGRGVKWLNTQVAKKGVRVEELRGFLRYNRDDVETLVDQENGEDAEAAALRAATNMVIAANNDQHRATTTLLDNNQKLYERQDTIIEKQRVYIEKLEESNLKMRAAAEDALSLENARALHRKTVEAEIAVKEKAGKMLAELGIPLAMKQLADWFEKDKKAKGEQKAETKPSSSAPANDATPAPAFDAGKLVLWFSSLPSESMMAFFAALKTVSAEKFAELKNVIPDGAFEALSGIYAKVTKVTAP